MKLQRHKTNKLHNTRGQHEADQAGRTGRAGWEQSRPDEAGSQLSQPPGRGLTNGIRKSLANPTNHVKSDPTRHTDWAGLVEEDSRRSSNPAGTKCLYRACFQNSVVGKGWGRARSMEWVCAWAQGHYRGWKCTVAVSLVNNQRIARR